MTPLSPSPAQGSLTSGQESRESATPLKGGNGCSSCGLHPLRGGKGKGKGASKSYRKKSNRKTRSAARKTRRNRRL